MFVEQLSKDNIDEYIQLLSPDEIFGTEFERYTAFGAYDEESGEVLGTISLEILADYVSIKSIYTAPEHRNKGVGTALIDFVRNAPGVEELPLCMITDAECTFLENRGFTKEESRYTIADGKLGNLERPRLEGTVRKGNIIRYLDEVEQEVIENYVEASPHDEFIQFPDMAVDPRRFSEGSLICFKNGEVTGALLMEEPEDYIQITWAHAASREVMMLMLSVIKTELDMEYETRKHIRFLQCDKNTSAVVNQVFHESEIRPINIFRSHIGG